MGASGGGGGGKSGAGASAGGGLGATATTGAQTAPAASSGLGAAQSTPISAVPQAGGIQSGQAPVSGIARPGAQEIVGQISPTTTPESSQAVVPSAVSNAQSTEAANVGNNPVQGALDVAAKYYTGGLIGAGAGNTTQSALPAMGQMTGQAGQSIQVPQNAPGLNVSPVGAVGSSPKGPGIASRAGGGIMDFLGAPQDPAARQQFRNDLFKDSMVQLAQQGKSNTTQSELPSIGGGVGNPSLAEIMQQLGIRGMADGGKAEEGEPVVVGEEGPEIAKADPGGGMTVTPMRQLAQFPEAQKPGTFQRIVEGLQDALIFTAGLQNPSIFINARAAAAEREAKLAELGLKNPTLLETSPGVARAAVGQVGQPAAEAVLRQRDVEERQRFEAAGAIEPAPSGTPISAEQRREAVDRARARGAGVKLGVKGAEIEFPSVQRKDMDAAEAYGAFHSLIADQKLTPVQAAQKIIEMAPKKGWVVPESILKLSNADNEREIAIALAEGEADARNRSEQNFASGTAFEREKGQRLASIDIALKPDEIAYAKTVNRFKARQEFIDGLATGATKQDEAAKWIRTREAQLNAPLESQEFFGSKLGGPTQPTPESARTRITQIDQGQRALDDMLKVANPDFIGPGAGRFGTVKEFFGQTGKSEAALRSQIRSLRRAYRLAQTGQQASDAELQRLYGELINENMGITQFIESLRVIGREIKNKYDSESASLLANNEAVPPLFVSERINKILGGQAGAPQAGAGADAGAGAPAPQAGPAPTPRTSRTPARSGAGTQAQAAREVGGTLANLKRELDAAVDAGEITDEQASKVYNRAEAAGALPTQ